MTINLRDASLNITVHRPGEVTHRRNILSFHILLQVKMALGILLLLQRYGIYEGFNDGIK